MNIQEFSALYRRKVSAKSEGSATERLFLGRVHAKSRRILTHVTVENKTSDYTKCRLGISNGQVDYYLDELTDIIATELVVERSDILLGEGDRFFAELTGTTSGDIMEMNCIGWEAEI